VIRTLSSADSLGREQVPITARTFAAAAGRFRASTTTVVQVHSDASPVIEPQFPNEQYGFTSEARIGDRSCCAGGVLGRRSTGRVRHSELSAENLANACGSAHRISCWHPGVQDSHRRAYAVCCHACAPGTHSALNHEVRNGLQVIAYHNASMPGAPVSAEVNAAVAQIEAALREISLALRERE
jgi:hypothetical protein